MQTLPVMLDRMALGVVDDIETAAVLFRRLLAAGSSASQLFLLGRPPLANAGDAPVDSLALRQLPSIAGNTLWTPFNRFEPELTSHTRQPATHALDQPLRVYIENCPTAEWRPLQQSLCAGQLLVAMLLFTPWEEVVYGRILLNHASLFFQSIALA